MTAEEFLDFTALHDGRITLLASDPSELKEEGVASLVQDLCDRGLIKLTPLRNVKGVVDKMDAVLTPSGWDAAIAHNPKRKRT